jgi:predicted metalloprotease
LLRRSWAPQRGRSWAARHAEINEALNAAAAVGDDRLQQQRTGRIDRESWTHGSSEQRAQWFHRGYDRSDPLQCDTLRELSRSQLD